MSQVRQTLGEIPIVEDELKRAAGEKSDDELTIGQGQAPTQKLVTSDGTYATQSSFSTLALVSCYFYELFQFILLLFCLLYQKKIF